MQGISGLAEDLSASQVRLYSMELVCGSLYTYLSELTLLVLGGLLVGYQYLASYTTK
jgi:hypothetical protein